MGIPLPVVEAIDGTDDKEGSAPLMGLRSLSILYGLRSMTSAFSALLRALLDSCVEKVEIVEKHSPKYGLDVIGQDVSR